MDALHAAFHRPGTRVHRVTQGVVWALIVVSIVLFVLDLALGWSDNQVLVWVDRLILSLFAVEIGLRVLSYRPPELALLAMSPTERLKAHVVGRLKYASKPLNIIDILTVLAFFPPMRGLRALRLLRLARLPSILGNPVKGTLRAFEDNSFLFGFGLTLLGTMVGIGGLSIWLVGEVDTLQDGMWWALVTITTVGYGDISPEGWQGRAVAAVLMVGGMFQLALFAGIVGHSLLNAVLSIREAQFRMSNNVDHIVICGYDQGAQMLLGALLKEVPITEHELVAFGKGERPSDLLPEFGWVTGDPTKESELSKARISHANTVLVVGARDRPPQEADASTILTVFTLRRYMAASPVTRKTPLYVIAEILDSENVEHARTAGADEVIQTTHVGFSLMAHAVQVRGTAEVLGSVVAAGAHSLFVGVRPPECEDDGTFGDLAAKLKAAHGVLLIGVRMPSGDQLNPPDSTPVANQPLLYLAEGPVLPEA